MDPACSRAEGSSCTGLHIVLLLSGIHAKYANIKQAGTNLFSCVHFRK